MAVNAAGTGGAGHVLNSTAEEFAAVIDTNLTSCFNCSRAVIESMRERGFGRIVNIGSINAYTGEARQLAYSISKGALMTMSRTITVGSPETLQS